MKRNFWICLLVFSLALALKNNPEMAEISPKPFADPQIH